MGITERVFPTALLENPPNKPGPISSSSFKRDAEQNLNNSSYGQDTIGTGLVQAYKNHTENMETNNNCSSPLKNKTPFVPVTGRKGVRFQVW